MSLAGKLPVKVPLEPWIPEKPWTGLHADIAGPVQNNYFLVIVDSCTRWPEIFTTRRITSNALITYFEEVFAPFGTPVTLVTDNGTQFKSEQFRKFCRSRAIRQIFSAPYHPQSNGEAERFVDTLKRSLEKLVGEGTLPH